MIKQYFVLSFVSDNSELDSTLSTTSNGIYKKLTHEKGSKHDSNRSK